MEKTPSGLPQGKRQDSETLIGKNAKLESHRESGIKHKGEIKKMPSTWVKETADPI
ncbi:MAG: hypothetical protein GY737_17355 [Desulfobacteraceae bacterium]|nr:hypothetical protein [Desulfobacteraceae bacterium]